MDCGNDSGVGATLNGWFVNRIKRQRPYANARLFWNASFLIAILFALGLEFSFYSCLTEDGACFLGITGFWGVFVISIFPAIDAADHGCGERDVR